MTTPARPLQPCGTRAAYTRHKKNGEQPCGPCTEANRAASRRTSAATRARRRANPHNYTPRPATPRRRKTSDSMSAAWQWEPAATIAPHIARAAAAHVARHAPREDVPTILTALGIEQEAA